MNLRWIVPVTVLLLKFYETECTTCSFRYSGTSDWAYGCQLTNQVIESESDLITIDGEHMAGHSDENVTWISSENSRIYFFPNRLLEHFTNLKQVNFDKSQMTSFLQPINCGHQLVNLTLADNLLTDIPDEIFANCRDVRTLILNRNNLGSVGARALAGLNGLTSLSLMNCNLSSIHPNAFGPLHQVADLLLSFNNLESLDPNLFRRLLRHVRVDNNRLSTIPIFVFSLQFLNLSHNQITHIDAETFHRTFWAADSAVDLSHNLIEELPIFVRSPSQGVTHLNLDNNRIKKIKPRTFDGLWTLTWLSLANNLIEDLQEGTFEIMFFLRFLLLNSNNITELQPRAFDGLQAVRELWLSDNHLTHLNADAFTTWFPSPLDLLWTLHAERNQIESIDRQLFDVLPSLTFVNLLGNVCADDNFSIDRDVNGNRIIPQMGTCSSATIHIMKLIVMAFSWMCHFVI